MHGLRSLLTPAETDGVNQYFDSARRRHPAWRAINADDHKVDYTREPKDHLTNLAVRQVASADGGDLWLKSIKARIAQLSDYEESVAALAELRCYGALLEAGFQVTPIPVGDSPTPDFAIEINGESGVVEVAAKLEHSEQTRRAEGIARGDTPEGVERSKHQVGQFSVEFVVSESHPFGAPDPNKKGDTTQANAISRICSIKNKETQLAEGKPSLLWIDFRDMGAWPEAMGVEQLAPLISGHGGTLTSGAFWYAFYGWKGSPIFEETHGKRQTITPMGHFGRFHPNGPKPSRYSGAVLCLSEAAVLFQNPVAETSISGQMRSGLMRLPWFNINHTVADWQPGDLSQALKLSESMIEELEKAALDPDEVFSGTEL